MYLLFLELGTYRNHLDFKIHDENNSEVIPKTFYLDFKIHDENNSEVIPKTFYLQLLNKQ